MGKKSHKETTTSAPPSWALGPLTSGMNTITSTVQGNAGNLNNIESGLTGMLPGLQQQVADTRQQLQPGIGYINDTLGGKYLNSNPYTTAMAQQAGQDAGNSVNATFSQAGRTGGGANQMMLAKGVDQAENSVLFQNYQNERGLQSSAAGMLPGMTAAEGASVAPYLAASQLAGQLPYYGLAPLSSLGGLAGNYGTTNATRPGGWGNDLLNAATSAASAAAMGSDRRLKKDIEKVGEAKDGLGIYTFRYRSDPDAEVYRGVMADEVEKLRPWALVKGFVNGVYDGVNYAALGAM